MWAVAVAILCIAAISFSLWQEQQTAAVAATAASKRLKTGTRGDRDRDGTRNGLRAPTRSGRHRDDGLRGAPSEGVNGLETWRREQAEKQDALAKGTVRRAAETLKSRAYVERWASSVESDGFVASLEEPGSEWRAKAAKESGRCKVALDKADGYLNARRMVDGQVWKVRAKQHAEAMNVYNAAAADEIFQHYNPSYNRSTPETLARCDLQGLLVPEATQRAEAHLRLCRDAGLNCTTFVTSRGNGNRGGDTKLKPALIDYLDRRGLAIRAGVPNAASIEVDVGSSQNSRSKDRP